MTDQHPPDPHLIDSHAATGEYFVHFAEDHETGLKTIGSADGVRVVEITPGGNMVIATGKETARKLHNDENNGIEALCAVVDWGEFE